MTKLRIASDFHLEFYTYRSHMQANGRDMHESHLLPKMDDEKNTILLLAGDTVCVNQIHLWQFFFENLSKRFKEIVMVQGNHEHYHFNINKSLETAKAFLSQFSNITILENQSLIIDDVEIFGATLWTNFDNYNYASMEYAKLNMSDFYVIQHGPIDNSITWKFTPDLSTQMYDVSFKHLKMFLSKESEYKKIVMTHHAPSWQSVSPKFKGSLLNAAFVNDLDWIIEDSDIVLWNHGHIHQPIDYYIGNTKIIANPFGYWEENKKYNSKLLLTV